MTDPAGVRPMTPGPRLDISGLAAAYAYPTDPPRGRWLRANMIATADGAAAASSGVTRGIANDTDRDLLGLLRALADVVLVGSGTVNAEAYGPVRLRPEHAAFRPAGAPPVPAIAIASVRLGLDFNRPLFTEAAVPTIVLTAAAAPPDRLAAARKVADVAVVGDDRLDLPAAVGALVERGFTRLLTEGGPGLLANLAAAGLLDELCLALSPLLAGAGAGRIMRGEGVGDDVPLRLGHALADTDGFLFLRYVTG